LSTRAYRAVTKDGVTVKVSIVRLEHESQWSLEVVNDAGTSIVWDDLFSSENQTRDGIGKELGSASSPLRAQTAIGD
jgi:hypothetical protein